MHGILQYLRLIASLQCVVWQEPVNNAGTTSAPSTEDEMEVEGTGSGTTATTSATASHPKWPTEIDLVCVSGAKVRIKSQSGILQTIFRDALEFVRQDLLFKHAFPSPSDIPCVLRKCLVESARRNTSVRGQHNQLAAYVHHRLLTDVAYEANMIRLVSHIISSIT
jgi:hypothetical protein